MLMDCITEVKTLIKVLIVDDELLVRVGLKSTLNWEDHGYLLVGEAKNAKEAIELFDRHSPEILLTDISMPGLNGLELISLLREKNPQLQSIILTHYEDFHYAREAVSLGVRDYIVKSNLTPERLLKVLNESEETIRRRNETSTPYLQDSCSVKRDNPERTLSSLLFREGREEGAVETLCSSLKEYLPMDSFQMALVSLNLNLNENFQLDSRQKDMIEDVASQVLMECPHPVIHTVFRNEIVFLFNFDSLVNSSGLDDRISHYMNQIKLNLKKYLNYYLMIGVSRLSRNIYDCKDLYGEARTACKQAFFKPNHIAVYWKSSGRPRDSYRLPEEKLLFPLLRHNRKQELMQYVGELFHETAEIEDFDYLKNLFDAFMDQAARYLEDQDRNSLGDLSVRSRINKSDFYSLFDLEAVRMHIVNLFNTILDSSAENVPVQNSYIVRKSIDYINAHYNENISLNNLAQNAEVSRSYLSFLFKQELGLNFSHYLTQTRINNAKDMLVKTNMKIYEIAEKVGFDSPYYFSKVFKETTGETCKEFRNRHYGDA